MQYRYNLIFRALRIPSELLISFLIAANSPSLFGEYTLIIAISLTFPLSIASSLTTIYIKTTNDKNIEVLWTISCIMILLASLISLIVINFISFLGYAHDLQTSNLHLAITYSTVFCLSLLLESFNKRHIKSQIIYFVESSYLSISLFLLIFIFNINHNLTLSSLIKLALAAVVSRFAINLLLISRSRVKFNLSSPKYFFVASLHQLRFLKTEFTEIYANAGVSILLRQFTILIPGYFLSPSNLAILKLADQITKSSLLGLEQARSQVQVFWNNKNVDHTLPENSYKAYFKMLTKKALISCIGINLLIMLSLCAVYLLYSVEKADIFQYYLLDSINVHLMKLFELVTSYEFLAAYLVMTSSVIVNAAFGPVGIVVILSGLATKASKVILTTLILYIVISFALIKPLGLIGAAISLLVINFYQNTVLWRLANTLNLGYSAPATGKN